MAKKYDVVVSRKYQSNGEEKTAYTNIGSVLEKNGKFYIKIDVIPTGWDGFASLYEPKPKEGSGKPKPQQQQDFTDDDFNF